MSYYMSQLSGEDFVIRNENKPAAMNALRNWEKSVLLSGESSLFGHAKNLEDMLHTLGWEAYRNENGDIVGISFIDETLCDEDQWMNAIAPFVERGSIIKMHGEDDCLWCWYFDGKCCTSYSGEVVFPDLPDEEKKPIYTHDEAALIVEEFEAALDKYGIRLPSPEDGERGEDNTAALYGSTYADLLDSVESALIDLLNRHSADAQIVSHEFSGRI